MRILMVCLGNICRSPLAEGILSNKIAERGLDWSVDSAGTGSWHIGEPPDRRSVAVAQKYGIDITGQRARQFHYPDFESFDLIYAMDPSNYNDILSQSDADEEAAKVKLILDEMDEGQNRGVPDPYWDDDGFEQVYHMLDAVCERILDKYA